MNIKVLTDEQEAQFVTDIIKYGTDFVAPLYATVAAIEKAVLQSPEIQALKKDAERYRWIRDEDGLMVLPYDDHGLGPEFPCGSDLDKAIDQARRAEEEGNKYPWF